jgi:hypothetical protein
MKNLVALLLAVTLFSGCSGGSLASDGTPLSELGQDQLVNLALRVDVERPQQQVNFQLAQVAVLEFRVLDAQSLVDVTDPVRLNPNETEDQVLLIPNVPVGLRVLRVEGFADPPDIDPGSGLPIALPGYSLDLLINVRAGAENLIVIQVDNDGITGSVPDPGIPVGQPGEVKEVGNLAGSEETEPEVVFFGLQGVITYRRSSGDVAAQVFRADSLNFTGPLEDVDGSPDGILINGPGTADRHFPQVAMDQLANFSIVWEDRDTADFHGRSFTADAEPLGPEELDITLSPDLGFDPIRPILRSTTNPDPPPEQGFGGEVRHLIYFGLLGPDAFIGYKTFLPDDMDCDPLVVCPPDSDLIDCPCLIADDICLSLPEPFPFPFPDSNLAADIFSDGFSGLVVFEDHQDVWLFTTRPWVGLNGFDLFKVNPESGQPGGVDVAPLGFSFSLAEDTYVVAYELDGKIFARSYASDFGVSREVTQAVEIGLGTQPRVAAANPEQFYLTWVNPQGEIVLDLFEHETIDRVSENPPHLVSDAVVAPGTSSVPQISASSFGVIVVWEGSDSGSQRTVFEKRFGAGFEP